MADEYIKRSDAIETLMQMCWHDEDGYPVENADEKRQYAEDWVNAIPSADVAEVRHGEWLPFGFGDYHWHKCSVCGIGDQYIFTTIRSVNREGNSIDIEAIRNFCPNCGADMRKDGE